ncbi:Uncharacterised protein [Mycobacteroides abscessus]|nr:Uncharacterised protein [Mycobacteroides abscessus]
MSRGRSTCCAPAVTRPMYGSVNSRSRNGLGERCSDGSDTTSATDPVRRVTSVRAARLGT